MENLPKNISLIVAMAKHNVIGVGNQLPWHLPEDLKHFKQHTTGKTILMGRKTYESIGRALPNRRNIVLSSDKNWQAAGLEHISSLEDLATVLQDEAQLMVIGGANLYQQMMPYATELIVTHIQMEVAGDAYFPLIDETWEQVECEAHQNEAGIRYDFCRYLRKAALV